MVVLMIFFTKTTILYATFINKWHHIDYSYQILTLQKIRDIPSIFDVGYKDAFCLYNDRSPIGQQGCFDFQHRVSSVAYFWALSCCQAMMHDRSCSLHIPIASCQHHTVDTRHNSYASRYARWSRLDVQ